MLLCTKGTTAGSAANAGMTLLNHVYHRKSHMFYSLYSNLDGCSRTYHGRRLWKIRRLVRALFVNCGETQLQLIVPLQVGFGLPGLRNDDRLSAISVCSCTISIELFTKSIVSYFTAIEARRNFTAKFCTIECTLHLPYLQVYIQHTHLAEPTRSTCPRLRPPSSAACWSETWTSGWAAANPPCSRY